jgi:DNA-binding response OmpR family regulator
MTAPVPRSVLLVEDEARVADFIQRGLKAEGYVVAVESTGTDALARVERDAFAVIVLDVRLPGMSGLEVCATLRAQGRTTPILMLTALDSVPDRVEGLRLGADDYLGKPFAFDELLARIEALARRSGAFRPSEERLVVGDLVLDLPTLVVTRGGRPVELTARELAMLQFLMAQGGRVVSRARILCNVWGVNEDPLTNVVDVFVRRLRRKIGDLDGRLLRTVRGYGYRLDAGESEEGG